MGDFAKMFGHAVQAAKIGLPLLVYLGVRLWLEDSLPARPDTALVFAGLSPLGIAVWDFVRINIYNNQSHYKVAQRGLVFNVAICLWVIKGLLWPDFVAHGLAVWLYSPAANGLAAVTHLFSGLVSLGVFFTVFPGSVFKVRCWMLEHGWIKMQKSGTNAQGSSEWMDHDETRETYGLDYGFIIGTWPYTGLKALALHGEIAQYKREQKWADGAPVAPFVPNHATPFLRYPAGKGGWMICAKTRSGKGRSLIMTNLCDKNTFAPGVPASYFVVDVKGELAEATYQGRKDMKRTVRIFDPFGLLNGTGAPPTCLFNVFDDMVKGPLREQMVTALAEACFPKEDSDKPHFREIPLSLIKGLVYWTLETEDDPDKRNLHHVFSRLNLPQVEFNKLIAEISRSPEVAGGKPAVAVRTLMDAAAEERGSHMTSAKRALAWLDNEYMGQAMSKDKAEEAGREIDGSFSLKEMIEGKTDFYLAIPENMMSSQARFMRMIIQEFLVITAQPEFKPKRTVTVVCDEAYQLGRIPEIIQAMGICAGRNVSLWIIWQNRGQGVELYKDAGLETLESGCALKAYFGVTVLGTAKTLSEELGKKTVINKTMSFSGGESGQRSGLLGQGHNIGQSVNFQEIAVPLMDPQQIMTMSDAHSIILVSGNKPLVTRKIQVDKRSEFAGVYRRPRNVASGVKIKEDDAVAGILEQRPAWMDEDYGAEGGKAPPRAAPKGSGPHAGEGAPGRKPPAGPAASSEGPKKMSRMDEILANRK